MKTSCVVIAAVITTGCSTTPSTPGGDPRAKTFSLECKSQNAAPTHLIQFTMERSDDGSVVMTEMDGQPLPDYATHTYVNAYTWTNGERTYTVDRFSGVMKVKPDGTAYHCRRPGAQMF